MLIGLLSALGACFVWGLIFIIPGFLNDFSPFEIAFGRYFAYGLLSCTLLFRNGFKSWRQYSSKAWKKAFIFGLFSNVFYYIGVVTGIRYSSAPITVLVLGMCPIIVAFYGNMSMGEGKMRQLFLPCLGIAAGMVLVNLDQLLHSTTFSLRGYCLGLLCTVAALISWSWFAVHNARFLKNNPDVPRSDWSTLLGVGTMGWMLAALVFTAFLPEGTFSWQRQLTLNADLLRFWGGSAILGVICSWVGCYLWNQASLYLPVSLVGPLIIFETIFGLLFVYLVQHSLPTALEFAGIFCLLASIVYLLFLCRRLFSTSLT